MAAIAIRLAAVGIGILLACSIVRGELVTWDFTGVYEHGGPFPPPLGTTVEGSVTLKIIDNGPSHTGYVATFRYQLSNQPVPNVSVMWFPPCSPPGCYSGTYSISNDEFTDGYNFGPGVYDRLNTYVEWTIGPNDLPQPWGYTTGLALLGGDRDLWDNVQFLPSEPPALVDFAYPTFFHGEVLRERHEFLLTSLTRRATAYEYSLGDWDYSGQLDLHQA